MGEELPGAGPELREQLPRALVDILRMASSVVILKDPSKSSNSSRGN